MNAKAQRGMTTVEFAIVGALALALIFYVIEFGRILFTLNVLDEGARRGARVAAVCDVGNAAISEAVRFVSLPGLTASNVVTEYLTDEGTVLGDPQGADYPLISFVRVTIDNYNFPVALPFVATLFSAPAVSVTMPRESLGVPYFGAPPAC
jgi:Flp pilus assembly protein TadG